MAITFTKTYQFRTAATILGGQQAASLFFWFRYEQGSSTDTAVVGQILAVGGQYDADYYALIQGSTPGSINLNCNFFTPGWNQSVNLTIGVPQPVMLTYAQGKQTLYVPNQTYDYYNATGPTNASQPFTIGDNNASGTCVYTLGNINAWGGYTCTQADYNALAAGDDPTTIGASATVRYRWTLVGPIGQTPAVGDPGLTNAYVGPIDFASVNGPGPAVYSDPLATSSSTRKKMLKFGGLLKYMKGSRYTP